MAEVFQLFLKNLNESRYQIFLAVLFFLCGLFVSKWLARLTAVFLHKIRLNQVFQRMGWEETLIRIDSSFSASKFFGGIVRWFFIILFLWGAGKIVGLGQFSRLLEKVIAYYPNIFISAFIFVAAVFLADLSQKIMVGTLEKEKIIYSNFLGRLARWLIWFLAVLAIFYQLKIASPLVLAIFIGLILTMAIALGIALGFGGKDLVKKALEDLENKFK